MRSKKSDLSNIIPTRLKSHSSVWKRFLASQDIINLVTRGHKMRFANPPTLTIPHPEFATKLPRIQMKIIRREVKELLGKGAIRKVSVNEAIDKPGFFSKLFAVPKPGVDKWRTIIDMRSINAYVDKKTFRMDGLKDVRGLLSDGTHGCVVDLSDAYYHIR